MRRPLALVLPALLAVGFLSSGCGDESTGSMAQPSIFREGADQVMLGVEHYITRDGVRRGLLRADTAFTFEDAARVELRQLELELYDETGANRGVLTARAGTYQLDSGDLTVRGDVELRGSRQPGEPPVVLETDSLRYLAARDELSTEARYTLSRADGTVERGSSLVTDPALRDIRRLNVEVTTPGVAVPQ